MCTVSIVPLEDGFRLVCNRDEQLSRPSARPPDVHTVDRLRSAWPVDPLSGGTWIGVNEAGLAACLLNRTSIPPAERPPAPVSRGTIIPPLLRVPRLSGAVSLALKVRASLFEPFTLLLLQGGTLATLTNISGRLSLRTTSLVDPALFTSSSLGDRTVLAPRRTLFEALVLRNPHRLQGQSAFHDHQWTDRPHISIRMRRHDAATVSQTTIDLRSRCIRLRYRPV